MFTQADLDGKQTHPHACEERSTPQGSGASRCWQQTSNSSAQPRKLRVLHCVGHLLRGGIEMGLFNILTSQPASQFEHHVLVRTSAEEPFTDSFRKAGIAVLSCCRYRNPLLYAIDLKKLIRRNGTYDILHVHGSSFSGLLTLALAKWCGIPWSVVHSHNDVRPTFGELGIVHRLYVTFVLAAYRGLADSGFAASLLAAESMFGVDWRSNRKWELLYYGIDCRPFRSAKNIHLRKELGISDSAIVIGHVGRFHEQKNHAFLLEIVEAAVRTNLEVVGLLVGDGPLREEFIDQVRRRFLEEHFVFVPDSLSVPSLMSSAMDCFVFPSRYEGLGLVVVEAQAAGLPCIISDRIPAEAIVDDSSVTVLSLEAGPEVWAEEALRRSREHRPAGFEAATRIEESRFNLEVCAATLGERYLQFSRSNYSVAHGAQTLKLDLP